MTNFPRVVEWGCLVMMLPTQVSQQTSGDSICFLSDLRARWEASCKTWDLQTQTKNKLSLPSVCYYQVSVVYHNPGILTLETFLKHRKPGVRPTPYRRWKSVYFQQFSKFCFFFLFPYRIALLVGRILSRVTTLNCSTILATSSTGMVSLNYINLVLEMVSGLLFGLGRA